ncbi:hypothetical protein [Neptunicella marina]|uniref:Uncharacterized protein n=1 Tax=Neptunicella marina TaxID=2125989 RepID=A0A8J6LVM4_9ALTE|nr:hypothetical protein [Neptunicella marina]MBC3764694.1 hypothetical protein [Neptunicella marina]
MDIQTLRSNLKFSVQMSWRRYKLYGVLAAVVIIHQCYLSLPCYVSYFGVSCWSNDTFEQGYAIFLSLLGFILITFSINGALRITHDMNLGEYFKSKTPPNPFREIKPWAVIDNAAITVSKPRFDAVATTNKEPETVEDLHNILKQHNRVFKNMVEVSEKRINERIESLRKELSPKTSAALNDIQKLKTVVITSIDGQLVGSILVLYSAFINM